MVISEAETSMVIGKERPKPDYSKWGWGVGVEKVRE